VHHHNFNARSLQSWRHQFSSRFQGANDVVSSLVYYEWWLHVQVTCPSISSAATIFSPCAPKEADLPAWGNVNVAEPETLPTFPLHSRGFGRMSKCVWLISKILLAWRGRETWATPVLIKGKCVSICRACMRTCMSLVWVFVCGGSDALSSTFYSASVSVYIVGRIW
jgi:hypothetical protein